MITVQLLLRQCITFINSNFHLNKEHISSNVRVNVLVNVIIFTVRTTVSLPIQEFFSSVQLLFRQLCSSIGGGYWPGVIGLIPFCNTVFVADRWYSLFGIIQIFFIFHVFWEKSNNCLDFSRLCRIWYVYILFFSSL